MAKSKYSNDTLLENCLVELGLETLDDWFDLGLSENGPLDSVHFGACHKCAAVSYRCEPDMRNGWCEECESGSVESMGSLAGVC